MLLSCGSESRSAEWSDERVIATYIRGVKHVTISPQVGERSTAQALGFRIPLSRKNPTNKTPPRGATVLLSTAGLTKESPAVEGELAMMNLLGEASVRKGVASNERPPM
jgi:hypothetical protein